MLVNISLLYRAIHNGRKISKLSFVESEYLRAITVNGHLPLNKRRIIPSIITENSAIQVSKLILLKIPEYIT